MTASESLAGAKPTQQARSRRTLHKLLLAAQDELAAVGADDITLSAVAHRAGVSVGTVYRRFGAKDQLLRAVKHRALDRLEQQLATALADPQPDLAAVIDTFTLGVARWMSENGLILPELIGINVGDETPDAATPRRGALPTLLTVFRDAVATHRADIRRDDLDTSLPVAVRTIVGAGMHRALSAHIAPDDLTWFSWQQQIADMTLAYLTTPARPQKESPPML